MIGKLEKGKTRVILQVARILEKKNSFGDTPVNSLPNKKASEYFHTSKRTELTGFLQARI